MLEISNFAGMPQLFLVHPDIILDHITHPEKIAKWANCKAGQNHGETKEGVGKGEKDLGGGGAAHKNSIE